MNPFHVYIRALAILSLLFAYSGRSVSYAGVRRLLYVAEPCIRDYLEYSGHGLLVFDMDRE
jgi:hypothetical protein